MIDGIGLLLSQVTMNDTLVMIRFALIDETRQSGAATLSPLGSEIEQGSEWSLTILSFCLSVLPFRASDGAT